VRSWLRTGRLMLDIGWEVGPGAFAGWVGLSLAGSLGPFLFAVGLKPLVDGVYYGRPGGAALGGALCAAAVLTLVAAPPTSRWVFPRVVERSIMAMRRRLLRLSTLAPGLALFERPDVSDRLEVLKRSFADLLQSAATVFVGPLILAQLLTTGILLGRIQPLLLLLPLLTVPSAWLNRRAEALRRTAEDRTAERRRAAEHVFLLASSAPPGAEIRTYGLREELLDRHRALGASIQRTSESALFRSVGLSSLGWLVFALGYVVAGLAALRAAAAGELTPGDVALTLTLAAALVAASAQLSDLAGLSVRAVAVADRYRALEAEVAVAGDGTQAPPVRAAIVPARLRRGFELEWVTFAYGAGDRPALDGVSLRLPAGTVVALVGENGAGKTTLVKLLARMYAPSRGRILLEGADLQELDVAEYRRRLAAGFQDFARFELRAREAVGVGDLPRLEDVEAVRRALRKTNAEFAERLAAGLETQLGRAWEGGVDLSGGEWQKLALARAMMRESPLLVVLDEPTASLDPQTEYALFEQVAADMREGAAADGRVTLLVSHRFSTVRMADLIVVLAQGRVAEQGSHEELLAAGGLYAELYGLQARAYG
jgi:ATP-binding cassette subfamily B protein